MVIVDTNVISELMRNQPHPSVLQWMDSQLVLDLYSTAITAAELRAGVAVMPSGKKRVELAQKMRQLFDEEFRNRILPFDNTCATHFAEVIAQRQEIGRPISDTDAMIAAICLAHDAAICTRDVGGFEFCSVNIINPWAD
jgi:toxin FitB